MNILNRYNTFLFYLIPIFLITGPFLADSALSLMALIGLINFLNFKKSFLKNDNKIIFFMSIFFLYIFINSLFAKYVLLAFEHSLFYFRYIFFLVSIYFMIKWKGISVLYIFSKVCFFTSVFVSLDLFLQFLTGFNILGFEMNSNLNGARFSGLFRDEWIAGSYLSRLLPFSIIYFFMSKNKELNLTVLISILIGIVAIVCGVLLSGERIASFFTLVFLLFFFFIMFDNKKITIIFSIFLISILSIFIFTDSAMKKRIINVTIDSFSINSNIEGFIIYTPMHHAHYLTAWNMFISKPIFGHGSKSFRVLCDDDKYEEIIIFESDNNGNKYNEIINGCSTHPHNFFLELISENGLIGFLIFYFLYFYIIYVFLSSFILHLFNKKYDNLNLIKLFCCLSFLLQFFPLIPSGSFFNNWLSVLYYLPLSIIYLIQNIKSPNLSEEIK